MVNYSLLDHSEPPDICDYSNEILEYNERIKKVEPFFNKQIKKISKKLWIPDLKKLDDTQYNKHLDFYNTSTKNNISNIKIHKYLKPYSLDEDYINDYDNDNDDINIDVNDDNTNTEETSKLIKTKQSKKLYITRKIPIFPSSNLKKFINLEIEAFETYYSMTINKINSVYQVKKELYKSKTHCIVPDCMNVRLENHSFLCHFHDKHKIDWGFKMTEKELRNELNVSNESINNLPYNHKLKKFLQVPYDLRAEGVRNALNSFSTCIKKYKKDKKSFTLKEKDMENLRRDKMAVFRPGMLKYITNTILLNPTVYKKYIKYNNLPEELPILNMHDTHYKLITNSNIDSFFQICKNKINKYYINILIPADYNKIENRNKVIAIDPGVRTFATGYDPSGTIIESYNDVIYNINMIHKKIDKTSSIIDKKDELKIKSKKIYKLKKQNRKRHQKVNNIVSDMHNQISSYLTKNYDSILYPPLETKKLVKKYKEDNKINTTSSENDDRATKKRKRKISSRTARLLSTLSFHKFLTKLKFQSEKNNCTLYILTEAFTSKTCGKCGFINDNLGSAKIYKCPSCNFEIGRDINGARNILLKHLE